MDLALIQVSWTNIGANTPWSYSLKGKAATLFKIELCVKVPHQQPPEAQWHYCEMPWSVSFSKRLTFGKALSPISVVSHWLTLVIVLRSFDFISRLWWWPFHASTVCVNTADSDTGEGSNSCPGRFCKISVRPEHQNDGQTGEKGVSHRRINPKWETSGSRMLRSWKGWRVKASGD